MAKKSKWPLRTFFLLLYFYTPTYGLWPYSSQGQIEICDTANNLSFVCDCTEPNVICQGLDLIDLHLILPDDTDVADFSRNEVSTVGKISFLWPTSIVEINLSRNQIKSIVIEAFQDFLALETLNLSFNLLESLDSKVLQHLIHLNNLDLSHNLLHTVNADWFDVANNNLIRLNLAYNYLGDLAWTEESLANLPWLEYLDLTNCSFGLLPIEIFHNNTRLKELR